MKSTHRLLLLTAAATVCLGLLPIFGMLWAWWSPPPVLVEPPPIQWDRVLPLLLRTLALAGSVATITALLGTYFAWLEVFARYPLGRLLARFALLPLAVPSYLLATIIREEFAPDAWLGSLLGREGSFTGLGPAILVLSLVCTPYVQLAVSAALRRWPASRDEAARSLGASPMRRFQSLLLPYLRPTWSLSLVVVSLYVVCDFGAVAVLNCEVLTWELYKLRGHPDAVVLGFALALVATLIFILMRRLHGRMVVERSTGGPRQTSRQPLGRWGHLLSYSSHGLFIGLGLLMPLISLLSWTLSGWARGESFRPLGGPLVLTAAYGVAGAVLTVTLAALPAWVATRHRDSGGRWIEQLTYLGRSLPGVLIAFGLWQLLLGLDRHSGGGASTWRWLGGSGLVLLFAYSLRFLFEAYSLLQPAVLGLDLRQEESARSLGASRWRVWRAVTLPGLRPGVRAGLLIVFLSIAKELPITLILSPGMTLAYRVYDAQQEASLHDVGLAGLLLLMLGLVAQRTLDARRADG